MLREASNQSPQKPGDRLHHKVLKGTIQGETNVSSAQSADSCPAFIIWLVKINWPLATSILEKMSTLETCLSVLTTHFFAKDFLRYALSLLSFRLDLKSALTYVSDSGPLKLLPWKFDYLPNMLLAPVSFSPFTSTEIPLPLAQLYFSQHICLKGSIGFSSVQRTMGIVLNQVSTRDASDILTEYHPGIWSFGLLCFRS